MRPLSTAPASYTDVRRFFGLANYYSKFVDRFANLAALLTALCSPRARFHWGETELTPSNAR